VSVPSLVKREPNTGMRSWRGVGAFLISLLLAMPWATAQPASHPPDAVARYTLDNGLRVWHQRRRDCNSVIICLVVRAGARAETVENNGVSHFLEHLVFDGTEKWEEEAEIARVITRLGGEWNAFTGYERTLFYAAVSNEHFDTAFDWITQVVFHPTLPESQIEKERGIVFREKGGHSGWITETLDDWGFGTNLSQQVRGAIFPDSTLAFSVIGEDASLDAITRETLLETYQRHYVPNNTALVVVGNVEEERVRETAETLLGRLEPKTAPAIPPTPALPTGGPQEEVVRCPMPTDDCRLMLGARTVGALHPDSWALRVLSELLNESLRDEVRHKRGLAYRVGAHNTFYSDAGYFSISASSERAKIAPIRKIAEGELEKIREGDIDPKKLLDAKTALRGRRALSMEGNGSHARWYASLAFTLGDGEAVPDYDALIERVTPEDLTRIVDTYFVPELAFVGMHLPILTNNSGAALAGGAFLVAALFLAVGVRARRRKKRGMQAKSAEVAEETDRFGRNDS
jgi:predicted Zn-dependent peptidase